MFSKTIKAATIALSIAGVAVFSAPATAGPSHGGISIGGAGFSISFGTGHGGYRGYRGYRGHRGYRGGGYRGYGYGDYGYRPVVRSCSPRRALRKARRIGLRDTYVARVKRHAIVIKGYRYGYPTRVKIGRAGRCPVLAVRSY